MPRLPDRTSTRLTYPLHDLQIVQWSLAERDRRVTGVCVACHATLRGEVAQVDTRSGWEAFYQVPPRHRARTKMPYPKPAGWVCTDCAATVWHEMTHGRPGTPFRRH